MVHASKSSVLRTTKKLGFSGYSELKYFLRHTETSQQQETSDKDIFEKQLDDIKKTLEYMQSVNLEPINEMFDKSQTIYCYATGFSQKNIIDEFYKMLLNVDKRALVLPNKTELDMVMPMIKISIPIFRRKYNAQQRESRHYREASELKYEDTLNQLHAEYIALKQQLADASRKIDLYAKQQDLSRSTYQLMIREFSAGTTSLTDIIQLERQLLDYSLKKSEAVAEYNTLVAGLEKLVSTSVNE